MFKRAAIYVRVSDESQIENNSLETQEKSCAAIAQSKSLEVARVFRDEGKSAKNIHSRPGMRELLAYCTNKKNNISYVIVYKIDRFSRNTNDGLAAIALLAKSGVDLISATEPTEANPMGEAIRTIFLALAQLDNQNKAERVKDNMLEVFRKGFWPFKPPVGYRRKYRSKEENHGEPLILHLELAPIIAAMFRDAATGIFNKVQLAKKMNLLGFEQYYGRPADHKLVDFILKKTFYYGAMYAKKWDEYAIGNYEPIIDEATFNKAYNKVILKKKNYSYHDATEYPLKGLLRCSRCHKPLTTCPAQGKTKTVYYYECRNESCKKTRINRDRAIDEFVSTLANIKPSERVIKLFEHIVMRDWKQAIDDATTTADSIDNQIYELKRDISSVRKSKDQGIYTVDEAKDEVARIRASIVSLEIERSEIRTDQYRAEIVQAFIEKFFTSLYEFWESLDLPKKQLLQNKIFPQGIIVGEEKKFRTPVLSPSFQLIRSLEGENVENVTPNRIELLLAG